jgi:hypothetical protein
LSVREYCRRHKLKETQFYWWQRQLKERDQERAFGKRRGIRGEKSDLPASFALVSEELGGESLAGIELVLANGRRLRIGRGVDTETLRTVLEVAEQEGC